MFRDSISLSVVQPFACFLLHVRWLTVETLCEHYGYQWGAKKSWWKAWGDEWLGRCIKKKVKWVCRLIDSYRMRSRSGGQKVKWCKVRLSKSVRQASDPFNTIDRHYIQHNSQWGVINEHSAFLPMNFWESHLSPSEILNFNFQFFGIISLWHFRFYLTVWTLERQTEKNSRRERERVWHPTKFPSRTQTGDNAVPWHAQ